MQQAQLVVIAERHAGGNVRDARRAMVILVALTFVSLSIFLGCLKVFGAPVGGSGLRFPAAFGVSSVLLLCGSLAMNRSLAFVKKERQKEFRRWLVIAAGIATLFMGLQSYGLLWMTPATR